MDVFMTILFCFVILSFFAVIFGFLIKEKAKVNKTTIIVILLMPFVLLLFWVINFEPKSFIRWDLLEHYKLVDKMREGGWEYAWESSQYKTLFVINFYYYLISLTKYNQLLPIFPLIIDLAIFTFIFVDMLCREFKENIPAKIVGAVFFVWLCCFGFKLSISGIRCVLAVSLTILGIYLRHTRNKIIPYIFLGILSFFIHPFSIIVFLISLLYKFKHKWILVVLFLLITLFINQLSSIIESFNNEYLTKYFGIFFKDYVNYSIFSFFKKTEVSFSSKLIYFGYVLLLVFLKYFIHKTEKKCTDNKIEKSLILFCDVLFYCGIAFCFNYLLIERFMYVTALGFVFVLPIYFKYNAMKINAMGFVFIFVLLFLFFFNDIYIFLVNYVGDYFLSMQNGVLWKI